MNTRNVDTRGDYGTNDLCAMTSSFSDKDDVTQGQHIAFILIIRHHRPPVCPPPTAFRRCPPSELF